MTTSILNLDAKTGSLARFFATCFEISGQLSAIYRVRHLRGSLTLGCQRRDVLFLIDGLSRVGKEISNSAGSRLAPNCANNWPVTAAPWVQPVVPTAHVAPAIEAAELAGLLD